MTGLVNIAILVILSFKKLMFRKRPLFIPLCRSLLVASEYQSKLWNMIHSFIKIYPP